MATKKTITNFGDKSGSSPETNNENYKVGKGKPPIEKRFSATNQPDRSKQIAATKNFHANRTSLKEMLNMPFKFPKKYSKIRDELIAAYPGADIDGANVFTVMALQMIQKAILTGDTNSFNAILNQSFGMPAHEILTPGISKMIIEVVHDGRDLTEGLSDKTGIFPVN